MSANKGFKIQSLAICLALILVLVVQSSRAKSVAEQSPTAYGLKVSSSRNLNKINLSKTSN